MKIKMTKVISLNGMYTKIKGFILPIKTTYKFTKLFNAINTETEFYTTQLNQIIDQYAEKDEDGKPKLLTNGDGIQLQKDYVQVAQEKLNELWNLDVDVPDIKFSIEELDTLQLTIEEFNELLPFIED